MADSYLENSSKSGPVVEQNVWLREWQLISSLPQTFVNGIAERAKEIQSNPWSCAPEVIGAAVVTGLTVGATKRADLLCRLMQSTKILAPLAKSPELLLANINWLVPRAALAFTGLDIGNRFVQPMWDTGWNPGNLENDKKWLGKNVGSIVVDYPLMGVGGLGGAMTAECGPAAIRSLRGSAAMLKQMFATSSLKSAQRVSLDGANATGSTQILELNKPLNMMTSDRLNGGSAAKPFNETPSRTIGHSQEKQSENVGARSSSESSLKEAADESEFIDAVLAHNDASKAIHYEHGRKEEYDVMWSKLGELDSKYNFDQLSEQLYKFVPILKNFSETGSHVWNYYEAPQTLQNLAGLSNDCDWIAYVGKEDVDGLLDNIWSYRHDRQRTVNLPNGARLHAGGD